MNSSGSVNNEILLSLGSNLGDRKRKITETIEIIESSGILTDLKISNIYKSEPVGFLNQPWFLNISILGKTDYTPEILLFLLKSTEYFCGREIRERWHERELDIDILLFGNLIINTKNLILPHPRMSERKFVLLPSSEIAGTTIHPISGKSVNKLLEECTDNSAVKIYSK